MKKKKTSTRIEKFFQEKLFFCIETDIDHKFRDLLASTLVDTVGLKFRKEKEKKFND
jgi:hypothetical protein